MNVADWLTLSRMLLLPLAVLPPALGWSEGWLICAAVTALAGATDYADGRVARRYGMKTSLGSSLDFIADKVFIGGMLIALAALGSLAIWIPLVVLGREAVILFLRRRNKGSEVLASDMLGKTKTAVSFLAVGWVALNESIHSEEAIAGLNFDWFENLLSLAPWAAAAAVVLTVLSGINYLARYFRLRAAA